MPWPVSDRVVHPEDSQRMAKERMSAEVSGVCASGPLKTSSRQDLTWPEERVPPAAKNSIQDQPQGFDSSQILEKSQVDSGKDERVGMTLSGRYRRG
jgi:hypothetical protein